MRRENQEVSMFIRLDVLCHLAHDVKKYVTDIIIRAFLELQ